MNRLGTFTRLYGCGNGGNLPVRGVRDQAFDPLGQGQSMDPPCCDFGGRNGQFMDKRLVYDPCGFAGGYGFGVGFDRYVREFATKKIIEKSAPKQ